MTVMYDCGTTAPGVTTYRLPIKAELPVHKR